MRILSLLPSATEIVCALGLREQLVGITHECDYPPGIEREKPAVIQSALSVPGELLAPAEIERRVNEHLRKGEGVYRFRPDLLEQLRPELVLTQGLCDVCAVPARSVEAAVRSLKPSPQVLSLNPTGLADVISDIRRVGAAAGRETQADTLAQALQTRVARVAERTRGLSAAQRPGVACIEWLDPIYAAGHWVPEMVALAGGEDVLAKPGVASQRVAWDAVCAARPQVVLVMPCGYDLEQTRAEWGTLTKREGWEQLPAVQAGQVYLMNATAYFSRPGPRLVDGLEQLAAILHPERFQKFSDKGNFLKA